MKIHSFQHAPFEELAEIENWIHDRGHTVATTHFYKGDSTPALDDVDSLIILGGAMNVYEYRAYPWLRDEKRFIEKFIETGKPLLGICLGAQLIADVLGAKVYQNAELEIGWFPVRFHESKKVIAPLARFPRELTALHWHGDTFDLPPGAVALAESDGCKHQAFAVGEKIIGLQFHLESDAGTVAAFAEECPDEPARYIQTRQQILAGQTHLEQTHLVLRHLLDALAEPVAVER